MEEPQAAQEDFEQQQKETKPNDPGTISTDENEEKTTKPEPNNQTDVVDDNNISDLDEKNGLKLDEDE